MKTIAIFGAQGHLGHSLAKRLDEIKPPGVNIVGTTDRLHNRELAARCDLAVIAVRPGDVSVLLEEIRPAFQVGVQILSFAACVSLNEIERAAGLPAARGMGDPWWNFAGFVHDDRFVLDGYEFLFKRLGKKMISLANEAAMDAFTAHFVQLYVALFLTELREIQDLDAHLDFLSGPMQSSPEELRRSLPQGDPAQLLRTLATPGGITEAAMLALRENPEMKPEQVFELAMSRIRKISIPS